MSKKKELIVGFALTVLFIALTCILCGCNVNSEIGTVQYIKRGTMKWATVMKGDFDCPVCGAPTMREVGKNKHYCLNPKCKKIWIDQKEEGK